MPWGEGASLTQGMMSTWVLSPSGLELAMVPDSNNAQQATRSWWSKGIQQEAMRDRHLDENPMGSQWTSCLIHKLQEPCSSVARAYTQKSVLDGTWGRVVVWPVVPALRHVAVGTLMWRWWIYRWSHKLARRTAGDVINTSTRTQRNPIGMGSCWALREFLRDAIIWLHQESDHSQRTRQCPGT